MYEVFERDVREVDEVLIGVSVALAKIAACGDDAVAINSSWTCLLYTSSVDVSVVV